MKDHTVFMLMIIVILFRSPTQASAQNISDQYWTLLRRTLTKIGKERAEEGERMDPVETILTKLVKCISLLPAMVAMVPID